MASSSPTWWQKIKESWKNEKAPPIKAVIPAFLIFVFIIIIVSIVFYFISCPKNSKENICFVAIPSLLTLLSFGFIGSLCWALLIYVKMRSVLWPSQENIGGTENLEFYLNIVKKSCSSILEQDAKKISENISKEYKKKNSIRAVASRHGQLSQLWFSIAITVLLAAVIFAIFQVSLASCEYIEKDPQTNAEIAVSFLSKVFIYSLFFACWLWAIRNYRAHWHAYVSNEYRAAALQRLDGMHEKTKDFSERAVKEKIILKEIDLLGSIPLSGYLEDEREETAAQKIIKMEEMLQELLGKSRK